MRPPSPIRLLAALALVFSIACHSSESTPNARPPDHARSYQAQGRSVGEDGFPAPLYIMAEAEWVAQNYPELTDPKKRMIATKMLDNIRQGYASYVKRQQILFDADMQRARLQAALQDVPTPPTAPPVAPDAHGAPTDARHLTPGQKAASKFAIAMLDPRSVNEVLYGDGAGRAGLVTRIQEARATGDSAKLVQNYKALLEWRDLADKYPAEALQGAANAAADPTGPSPIQFGATTYQFPDGSTRLVGLLRLVEDGKVMMEMSWPEKCRPKPPREWLYEEWPRDAADGMLAILTDEDPAPAKQSERDWLWKQLQAEYAAYAREALLDMEAAMLWQEEQEAAAQGKTIDDHAPGRLSQRETVRLLMVPLRTSYGVWDELSPPSQATK